MTKIIRSLNRIALNTNRVGRTSTPVLKVYTNTECLTAYPRFFSTHSYSKSNNSELDFSADRKVVSQSSILGKDADDEIDPFAACQDFAVSNDEWSTSFYGVGSKPFDKEVIDILLAPVDPTDIEIKPDGLLYLPEIKYRRILNRAFGPGGWGIIPRGPTTVTPKNLSREYALICDGRFVSQARGEQDYFDRNDISVAAEGAKSNALTRCCKDLGIASELWDPSFVRKFKSANCEQAWVEHVPSKKRRQLWHLKNVPFEYPYRAT